MTALEAAKAQEPLFCGREGPNTHAEAVQIAQAYALISIAESLAKLVEAQDIEFERMELMKLGADIG